MMVRTWGMVLALVAAGCGPKDGREPRAGTAPPRIAVSKAELLLERHCASCHDGSERPALGAGKTVGSVLAQAAVLRVSAYEMPPPPVDLTSDERRELIAELCRLGMRNPDACIKAYAPRSPVPDLMPGEALLRAASTVAPSKDPNTRTSTEMLFDLIGPDLRVVKSTPSIVALEVALAMERCPDPTSSSDAARRFEACVSAMLDDRLYEFPSPSAAPKHISERSP